MRRVDDVGDAVSAQTTDGRSWLARGRECLRARQFDAAESCFRGALEQDPHLSEAYELLGKLLYRDGRCEETAALYRQWLSAVPEHPVAAHLAAATGSGPAPPRASDSFIVSLYERAAPEFDTTLAGLGYRAPELIFECAVEVLPTSGSALDVLDLGCGTGLCGDRFRSRARRLVGVDLSGAMLGRARGRGCYDELVCEELTSYLRHCAGRFDLVTAADVFCYFGDLQAVFSAVARVVSAGGHFVFSVEELTDAGATTELLEHGRYAHSRVHIERALASAGLALVTGHSHMLRFERGAPVQGLIVVAEAPRRRSAATLDIGARQL